MTDLEASAGQHCMHGHEGGPSQTPCPLCGPDVATPQPPTPPGWYSDQTNPTMVRWWDGTAWSEHSQPRIPSPPTKSPLPKAQLPLLLILAGAGSLVLVVAIIAIVAVSRSHDSHRASAGGSSTPNSAMWDQSASRSDVLNSIKQDYCTGLLSHYPEGGYDFLSCAGPDRNGVNSFFRVYDSSEALQLALNSGAVDCMQGGTAVIGPTWAANLLNPTDAAALVAQGATSGTCN